MIDPLLRPLAVLNSLLLRIGLGLGTLAVALMVVAILVQVIFRYVLNNPLPWPEEAARFCMLWMAGLMSPTALRQGGFVAIDTLQTLLPQLLARVLSLLLLVVAMAVIVVGIQIGWNEVTGFGGKFKTASLYVPLNLSFDEWLRVPRSWMMASLFVGFALMGLVTLELMLRTLRGLPVHVAEQSVGAP